MPITRQKVSDYIKRYILHGVVLVIKHPQESPIVWPTVFWNQKAVDGFVSTYRKEHKKEDIVTRSVEVGIPHLGSLLTDRGMTLNFDDVIGDLPYVNGQDAKETYMKTLRALIVARPNLLPEFVEWLDKQGESHAE